MTSTSDSVVSLDDYRRRQPVLASDLDEDPPGQPRPQPFLGRKAGAGTST
jgi:hypothetical protein